jgi:type I restriction enzyme M protein
LNPVRFLPCFHESLADVIHLGDSPDWELRRLGEIARVFNGPRFRRPYADAGRSQGVGIHKYFTGTALTQAKGENLKYLDESKADRATRKCLAKLRIQEGWILITDSGTLGRVIYARKEHHGSIATNNLIRVVIEDHILRGYVYQFLQSRHGQDQLLQGTYGTNQDHIEPEHVREVLIPIPKDRALLEEIGRKALESVEHLQASHDALTTAAARLKCLWQ